MSDAVHEPWMDEILQDLQDWIRIPSIASDPRGAGAMLAGAEWTAARLRRFCPDVAFADLNGPGPLVIAHVPASQDPGSARTFLIYGHYDVQPAGEGWTVSAFEPLLRDGWLMGRGSSDDKGQFLALIKAVEMLAAEQALPVNIVFLADSAEETLGEESSRWLRAHHQGLAGAILFDSSFLDEHTPVINTSTRGLVQFEISCRTGRHDLHSGLAGGAARNALHELVRLAADLLPAEGLLAPALMEDAIPPTDEELECWMRLPSGAELLAAQGGQPADATAAAEYYLRTWARPALDVHNIRVPSADGTRTAVITRADLDASIRLAPGQRPEKVVAYLQEVVARWAARSPGSAFALTVKSCTGPSLTTADSELSRAGAAAFEQVWHVAPQFLRAGGTLPIVGTLADLHLPFLLSGLHLPEGNAHGPDEKILLRHLFDGVRLVMTLLQRLGT